MEFALVCLAMLAALAVVAAIANRLQGGSDTPVEKSHDCGSCSAVADGSCAIGCLLEEKKRAQRQ